MPIDEPGTPPFLTGHPAGVSLRSLLGRFWGRCLPTWVLVLAEGALLVAMPLVIGWAVDGLMAGSATGVWQLSGLLLLLLLVGSGRRFYDTRAYGRVYVTVADELVVRERAKGTPLTGVSARTGLFSEFVEFLEESIPGIIQQVINLFGTIVVIVFIDVRIFGACLVGVASAAVVYAASERRILRLNAGGNDELERQVATLSSGDRPAIRDHFSRLVRWRIRLSDLETLNFSLIWIVLAAVLVFTVVTMTTSGNASFGRIVTVVMYVFGVVESVMAFPLYYQQLIRLREITSRLARPQHAVGSV